MGNVSSAEEGQGELNAAERWEARLGQEVPAVRPRGAQCLQP